MLVCLVLFLIYNTCKIRSENIKYVFYEYLLPGPANLRALYHDPKNAAWSPASYLNARDSEQQTATVPGNLQYRADVPNNARNAEGSTAREELHLHQIDACNGGKEGTAVCGGCGPQGAEEVPAPSFFVCSY